MENKTKLMVGVFILATLVSLVFAEGMLNKDISLDSEKVSILEEIGIQSPEISPCIKIDDFVCKVKVYEIGGINKEIEITYKFCEKYIFEEVNTTCLEYEPLYPNEECLLYNTTLVKTSECDVWKTLTTEELEVEIVHHTDILLNNIADVYIERNKLKVEEAITESIQINLDEQIKETI